MPLLLSGFGLDRLYAALLVKPYEGISRFLWHTVDETVLDRGLLRSVMMLPVLAGALQGWTTGLLSTSLKMLFLGFTAFLVFLAF